MSGKAKIYTLFASRGYGGAGGTPETLVSNDQLLGKLEERCEGVDFISRDLTRGFDVQSALSELEDLKGELDGVLIVGVTREYRFMFTGLPTIVGYNLFEFMNIPYELFIEKGRILTATLDRIGTTVPSISSAMFEGLVEKIDLIGVLRRMKESTMISVSPYKYFHAVDYQGDIHDRFPDGYNEAYTEALEESLGIRLIRVKPGEYYDAVKGVDEWKAEEIAKMWISEAKEVKHTTEEEVVKAARMYLAFETLRRRYGAVAIPTHMRSLTGSGKVEDMAWPGIGIIEFQKRGLVGVCQDYPNIAATHLLGLHATGRPSMLGDLMVDTFNGVDIILHCGAPINPHGNDRVPYTIWSHAESPVRGTGKPGSGTGVQVELPVDEAVTIWKLDVLNKRILLHTGISVDGRSLYNGFDELMCRTKLVARVEAEKVQSHFCPGRYGIHRAATFGDFRRKIKDIATLIGFEVVEEDR